MSCSSYPRIEQLYSNMSMEDYLRVYSIQDSIILKEGLSTFFLTLKQNNIYFNKKSLSLSSVALNFYIKG